MLGDGVDALVVSSGPSIRWLTGFTGSAGTVVLTRDDLVLVTDGRYAEQAQGEIDVDAVAVVAARELQEPMREALGVAATVALEGDDVSWQFQRTLSEQWLPGVELVPVDPSLRTLRSAKQAGEIERIRRAAAITDQALAEVLAQGLVGRREADVAWEVEGRMRAAGAERAGYDLIVASGPNGARPHHQAGPRQIGTGDLIVIDIGAEVDGYRSDMTRSYVTGPPTERQQLLLDTVTRAQDAGVALARAGSVGSEIDQACRSVLASEGLADAFVHGVGHGVGLEIHEPPMLGRQSGAVLESDWVVTVEPGVYFPGEGGVRVEDTVLVTSGEAERLTRASKEPVLG
jgi:Xaa-Pro aminopeptidase